jgi:hypothetical protein
MIQGYKMKDINYIKMHTKFEPIIFGWPQYNDLSWCLKGMIFYSCFASHFMVRGLGYGV